MKRPNGSENDRGFSLIELMVVIAIIGILSAIVLTNRNSVIAQAKVSSAANLLVNTAKAVRQKSISISKYQGTLSFPSYGLYFDTTPGNNDKIFEYVDCVDNDSGGANNLNADDYFAFDPASPNNCTNNQNKLNNTVLLGNNVVIKSIALIYADPNDLTGNNWLTTPQSNASIEYLRPEPTVWISGADKKLVYSSKLVVTIGDAGGLATKNIFFHNTGLIYSK